MSEYNKTILTNEGIDLARRANKGTATFSLTRGVSSTDNLSGKTVEELQNLTALPSIQQSVILSDVVNTTDNPDTVLGIRMTFDNQNLKTGYNVHTVGIYAKEPGRNEILYGVATAKTPEYIPDFGEQTLFKFDFLMYLVIGRTDKVTVEVSPDDVYRKRDTYNKTEIDAKVSDAVSKLNNKDAEILKNLNDYKQENKTYHQNLEQQLDTKADKSAVNQQLETKADKATTYTKDEVDNRILPKADKSYVDGELSKKADKTTTYTKDEVNSKIAGDLTNQSITSITDYDVGAEVWHNIQTNGFSSSGNFANYLVDAGALKPIAHSINVLNSSALMRGGGEMTKGSTILWQGTNAGPNIHEGNIGGLQWNGATDYVKIFGDNNASDNLDLAIQLGDDNSNHISIRDKDGTERAAITAGGHFTGSTDWTRVGGTGLNNPTLGRYIQHSNTWNDIIGQNNGQMALTAIRDDSNGSENTIGQHSAGVAFGGGDTKGVLSVAWDKPQARIIGGNGNSPTWKKDIAWKDDINNANPSVTVINSFDVANVKEGPHQTWPVKQPWLVDQMALHPFADAINALNTNLSTLRTELMNLKRRVDYNSPQGEFNNTTVNINDLRSTGIYRFANCYIQNGPYPTNNTHWIYLQVTVFDANTVYQTLYEGDNMYGRKSSSPTNWGKWHKYLNQEV